MRAQRAGLTVPRTIVSSDSDAVRTMMSECATVIHKAMSVPDDQKLLDARRMGTTECEALEHLELAPSMFQEEVAARYEVRVTIVGDKVFAARFDLERLRGVDVRLERDTPCEPHDLPTDVADALRSVARYLGITMCCVDLRVTDAGEYVFLELNPEGQYLFIEVMTGLPITRAVVDYLASRLGDAWPRSSSPEGVKRIE